MPRPMGPSRHIAKSKRENDQEDASFWKDAVDKAAAYAPNGFGFTAAVGAALIIEKPLVAITVAAANGMMSFLSTLWSRRRVKKSADRSGS